MLKKGLISDQLEYSTGLICSTIANFAGKIATKDFKSTDFMPSVTEKVPEQKLSDEQLNHRLQLTFAAVNRSISQRKSK